MITVTDITHRDEEHRQSVCMLPEGHAPLAHDDCMGCTWTDADHWQHLHREQLVQRVQDAIKPHLHLTLNQVRLVLSQACRYGELGELP